MHHVLIIRAFFYFVLWGKHMIVKINKIITILEIGLILGALIGFGYLIVTEYSYPIGSNLSGVIVYTLVVSEFLKFFFRMIDTENKEKITRVLMSVTIIILFFLYFYIVK